MFDSDKKVLPALIYAKNNNLNLFNYPIDVRVRSFPSSGEEFFNKLIDEQLMEPVTVKSCESDLKSLSDDNESVCSESSEKRFISCAFLQPKYVITKHTDSIMIIPGQRRNIYKTGINIVRKYDFEREPVIEISDGEDESENIIWTSTATIHVD